MEQVVAPDDDLQRNPASAPSTFCFFTLTRLTVLQESACCSESAQILLHRSSQWLLIIFKPASATNKLDKKLFNLDFKCEIRLAQIDFKSIFISFGVSKQHPLDGSISCT